MMVTGSHIPEAFNGIKFYRRDGELRKEDEEPIRAWIDSDRPAALPDPLPALPPVEPAVAASYADRYLAAFPKDALRGLKVGVHLHSAAGRDLVVPVLEALGADCRPFGRAERFVAVDTEALEPRDLTLAREKIASWKLDGVVSTDGDGDRPLMIDERGDQINGDVLGALTARALGIDVVVTPLTSTSAIEMTGWFRDVVRTRIGSPYVVAGMEGSTGTLVAGFEPNGGFLLGSAVDAGAGPLAALPTRDALLPIICVLAQARLRRASLSELTATMPARIMKADRIKEVPPERGQAFLDELLESDPLRAGLDPRLAAPRLVSTLDGVRLTAEDGVVVHFRQSGNAPELRCYVEASGRRDAEELLVALMEKLRARFSE
jgi:phosphomannomutase